MRILVIGGGIGGLSAAIALQRRGLGVSVFERAGAIREVGAGIMLGTNAVKVLDALGVGEALRGFGDVMETGEIRSASGRVLSQLPMAELRKQYGAPTLCVHRADLQRVLYDAVEEGTVVTGWELEGYEQDEAEVRALFKDGAIEPGTVLVGADGISSAVRAQLLNDGPPRYAGYTVWRGVAPDGGQLIGRGIASETHGRGTRFGMVSIGRGRVYWFAVANRPRGVASEEPVKETLRAMFGAYHEPIPAMIEATPEEQIVHNDCCDRPPAARWGDGRVTLLGDAAHAMTPNLGQGACQAIEDSAVLAHYLGRGGDPVGPLRAYEAARQPRTARIQRDSWRVGRITQWEHPVACRIREGVISLMPKGLARKQYDFLFRFDAPS